MASLVAVASAPASAAYPGRNGKIIFQRYDDPWTTNGAGTVVKRLRRIGADTYGFTYSPNGKKIAFEAWVPQIEIWVMNRDGSNARSVTRDVRACIGAEDPTWSPDGRRIAFSCSRRQGFSEHDIYSIGVGGGGLKRVTRHGDAHFPAWSPAGGRIAFATNGNTIHTVPAAGGTDRMISSEAPGGVFAGAWQAPEWSPDGKSLLVESSPEGIYIMNPSTGATGDNLAPQGADPVFSPDGRRIAYVDFDSGNADIWSMKIDGSDKRQITSGPAQDWEPDWGVRP